MLGSPALDPSPTCFNQKQIEPPIRVKIEPEAQKEVCLSSIIATVFTSGRVKSADSGGVTTLLYVYFMTK